MTPFKRALMIVGFNYIDAANFLDCAPSTIRKYMCGTRDAPDDYWQKLSELYKSQALKPHNFGVPVPDEYPDSNTYNQAIVHYMLARIDTISFFLENKFNANT